MKTKRVSRHAIEYGIACESAFHRPFIEVSHGYRLYWIG
jgi:hypothetical protein